MLGRMDIPIQDSLWATRSEADRAHAIDEIQKPGWGLTPEQVAHTVFELRRANRDLDEFRRANGVTEAAK
jgi:hypothetical protein